MDATVLRAVEARLAAGEIPTDARDVLLEAVRHVLHCTGASGRGRAYASTERRRPRKKAPRPHKGHGRNGVEDYPGAKKVDVPHPGLRPGDRCPGCGRGRLRRIEPSSHVELDAAPPVTATTFQLEVLRCSSCQMTHSAPLPPEARGEKYSPRVDANLAMTRFQLGVPHERLAQWQDWSGVPLAPSTQFDRIEVLANRGFPVFRRLQKLAANRPLLYSDDTGARILSLQKENASRGAGERTGVFTTVIIAAELGVASPVIVLFASGRRHAGENLDELFKLRDPTAGKVIHMADASSRVPSYVELIDARCLTHARRYFFEAEGSFPEPCAHVLDEIAHIYRFEDDTEGMSPQQRLRHHQEHSAPVLEKLHAWIQEQEDQRLVEPNSQLGKAFRYLRNHWKGLTRFHQIPGVPIDNNRSERELKPVQRHRKNSLFFKTEAGAAIGDVLLSLIRTCVANGVDPFHYLEALGAHAADARGSPDDWLPWTYNSTLQARLN